jgi:hypothetical protein
MLGSFMHSYTFEECMKSPILAPLFTTRSIWLNYRKSLNLKFDWRIPFKYDDGLTEIKDFLHGTSRSFYLGGFRDGDEIEDFLWEHCLRSKKYICKHLKIEYLHHMDRSAVLAIRKKGTHIHPLRSAYNLELAELDDMIKWKGEADVRKKMKLDETNQQQK